MSSIDTAGAALRDLAQRLDSPDLDPDPSRTDWRQMAPQVRLLRDLVERDVLPFIEPALATLGGPPESVATARANAAEVLADAAVLLRVAGERSVANDALAVASRVAPASGPVRDGLDAARTDLEAYGDLARARWLFAQRRFRDADRLLRATRRRTRQPALRHAAATLLEGSRPIDSAPALARINGFGVGLYGARDRRPDGSYVATHCVSALFVPVFPLAAYRVVDQGGRRYGFLSREPLSRFARGFRVAVAAAVLLGVPAFATQQWLDSPAHRASVAIARATADERAGRVGAALAEYEAAIARWGALADRGDLDAAATGVVRLACAQVHAPLGPDDVDAVGRAVLRYENLAPAAHGEPAAALLTGRLVQWSRALGAADLVDAQASLRVLDMAARTAQGGDIARVGVAARATHVALGNLLAADAPVDALAHYAEAFDDPAAVRAAEPAVRAIVASPSLALAAEHALAAWSHATSADGALAAQATAALETAHRMVADADRNAAIEHGDAAGLAAALLRFPGDQDVVAAQAMLRRGAGDPAGGAALITVLGAPGRLTAATQRALAVCLADGGRLDDADALLSGYVAAHLPAFQTTQHALDVATRTASDQLRLRLEGGEAPPELRALESAPEDQRRDGLRRWAREQMDADPAVALLRATYEQQLVVVPVVLELGAIKLRRAAGAPHDARATLLAEAERLFLAIREEAADSPEYHLALGQVYHRLGRAEDGEREMNTVLAASANEPDRALSVAATYRELGLLERAQHVAQDVFEHATDAGARAHAAMLLASTSDRLEDTEMWLRRVPQDTPGVQRQLSEVSAQRLQRDGQLAEADRGFADVVASYAREDASDPAVANNRALAEESRYLCTGDPARLAAAVDGLERAVRLQADSAIATGNLAATRLYQAEVTVLGAMVRTSVLRLGPRDASGLLDILLSGPSRDVVLAALQRNAPLRRALDLARQGEVLAPNAFANYDLEREILTFDESTPATAALLDRVEHAGPLDRSQYDAAMARWVDGSDDAQTLRSSDASVADAQRLVAAAEATHHAPTVAAARAVLAGRLLARARVAPSPLADAEAAVAALRAADTAWPALGVRSVLAHTLLLVAALHARDGSPALAEAYRTSARTRGIDLVISSAVAASPAVRAALRARPEATEALALYAALPADRPRLSTWIIARALDEPALVQAHQAALADPYERTHWAACAAINPSDRDAAERLALVTHAPH